MLNNLHTHPRYDGLFTTDQYPGAYPNGSRVTKINAEPGDTHQNGSTATVLGSFGHPDVGHGYFVEWDDCPKKAVFIEASKVQLSTTH